VRTRTKPQKQLSAAQEQHKGLCSTLQGASVKQEKLRRQQNRYPASNKEKETHWSKCCEPPTPNEKENYNGDLEGGWQPPAPDLQSNYFFRVRVLSTPSFWEWVAPSTTITRWSL